MSVFAPIQRLFSQHAPTVCGLRANLRIAAVTAALLLTGSAVAVEQAEDFVKGLQQRGLDELALEYLDHLRVSPLASEATKKRIPYLRGVALVEQSRRATDAAAKRKLLDDARTELEKFAETASSSLQGADAQLQLATVEMSRGQELMAQAAQLPGDSSYDERRRDTGREARQHFAQARETYQRAEAIFSNELQKLPPTTSAEARDDTGSRRQELHGRVAQMRFLAAQMQFETGQTYDAAAGEFRTLNESAAQELAAVYDEFGGTMLIGLYARLYEGRCYQAIGNYQLALGCYEELLAKGNPLPPFRKLAASAVHRKAEALIAQGNLDAAIDACRANLKDAQKDEERQPEWLAVRFRLAAALTKQALSLPAESAEQRRAAAEARDAYRFVARLPGEFQAAARAAASATKANGVVGASGTDETTEPAAEEPKSFQAAYDLGKDALAAYNAAKLALPSAEKNNPPAVPELQAQMERGKEGARRCFRIATTLIDVDTDPKLVNEVRYFLCWLYWEAEDYYRAAVLGEFLARRFPDHSAASSAAKISMASFERLLNQATATRKKQDNGDFEAAQMAQMAQFIVRRWPGTPDADAAFGVLVGFAIRSGNMESAEKMLAQASAQSRPRLELLLGNALWGRYLELSQSVDNAATPDALAAIKASATKYMQSGLEAARKESRGTVTESAATAALYLAQSLLNDGNYAEAIAQLEDESFGPLALIKNENPTAAKPQYAIEAYKAALRAYVSVTPPREENAISTMQALEKAVQSSGQSKAAEQLTRIYIGLGVALEKQMQELRVAGKQPEAERVSRAFATFLDRIATRSGNANWPTRAWLAQMYYTLGAGDTSPERGGASPSPAKPLDKTAREYLTKSRDAYETLLADVAKAPKLAPSETAVLAAKMQLGECLRELGQYQQALDLFSDVLKEKEASLAVQRAAALTYQRRGEREGHEWFEFAIHGGYKLKSTGQNRIWGWLRISQVAGRVAGQDEKFHDAFYEARLNVARCRYQAAMKLTGDARRQDLSKAKQSIQSLAQLRPELGGPKWKPAFDQLMQQIQHEGNKLANAAGR